MKNDPIINLNSEKQLNDALNNLATEELPSRELWPEIESQLKIRETKAYTPRWIPWAFAATLLLSFSATYVSWNNLQNANQLMADQLTADQLMANKQFNLESANNGDIQSQIKSMEQEYGLAKSVLLTQIGMNASYTDSDLLSDVKSNLIIIEQATSELKAAIIKQPENPNLPKLLKTTYQQELVVLSQLAKLNLDS